MVGCSVPSSWVFISDMTLSSGYFLRTLLIPVRCLLKRLRPLDLLLRHCQGQWKSSICWHFQEMTLQFDNLGVHVRSGEMNWRPLACIETMMSPAFYDAILVSSGYLLVVSSCAMHCIAQRLSRSVNHELHFVNWSTGSLKAKASNSRFQLQVFAPLYFMVYALSAPLIHAFHLNSPHYLALHRNALARFGGQFLMFGLYVRTLFLCILLHVLDTVMATKWSAQSLIRKLAKFGVKTGVKIAVTFGLKNAVKYWCSICAGKHAVESWQQTGLPFAFHFQFPSQMYIQRGGTFFFHQNLVKSIRDWALPISMSKPEVCLVPATFLVDPHSALHFKTLMQVAFEIKIGLVQSPAFHFVQRRARQPPSLPASQFTICSSRFAPLRVFSLVHGQSYQTPNSSKNLFRAAHALNKHGKGGADRACS